MRNKPIFSPEFEAHGMCPYVPQCPKTRIQTFCNFWQKMANFTR